MQRLLPYLLSPECLLGLLNLGVITFCVRHRTYSDADVAALEKLAYLLPLLVTLAGFAQVFVPGEKSWGWLARANLETWVTLVVCGYQCVAGFGAPGSGPKGQDVGLLLIVSFGLLATAMANAFALAQILRVSRPQLGHWLSDHPVWGMVATGAAALPVMVVQVILFGVLAGGATFAHTLLRRL